HPVISAEELVALQDVVAQIPVDDSLVDYMLAVVERTRSHESLAMGVSPRGAQALYRATQALAAAEGRDYATPDDVKRLVAPVCGRPAGRPEHSTIPMVGQPSSNPARQGGDTLDSSTQFDTF